MFRKTISICISAVVLVSVRWFGTGYVEEREEPRHELIVASPASSHVAIDRLATFHKTYRSTRAGPSPPVWRESR